MDDNTIKRFLRQIWCKIKDLTKNHNELQGLQGGLNGEYYHLSEDQYNCVVENCSNGQIGVWDTETTDPIPPIVTFTETINLDNYIQNE